MEVQCVECGKKFRRKKYMAEWKQSRGPFCGFACYASWQSRNLKGKNNPNYREEAWLTLDCKWCGEKFRRRKQEHLRGVSASKNAFCSRGCFEEYAVLAFKHKAVPWGSKIWKCRRNLALVRDGKRCVDCGSKKKLVVHHLKPFASFENPDEANKLSNLATVCDPCHRRRHEIMKEEAERAKASDRDPHSAGSS